MEDAAEPVPTIAARSSTALELSQLEPLRRVAGLRLGLPPEEARVGGGTTGLGRRRRGRGRHRRAARLGLGRRRPGEYRATRAGADPDFGLWRPFGQSFGRARKLRVHHITLGRDYITYVVALGAQSLVPRGVVERLRGGALARAVVCRQEEWRPLRDPPPGRKPRREGSAMLPPASKGSVLMVDLRRSRVNQDAQCEERVALPGLPYVLAGAACLLGHPGCVIHGRRLQRHVPYTPGAPGRALAGHREGGRHEVHRVPQCHVRGRRLLAHSLLMPGHEAAHIMLGTQSLYEPPEAVLEGYVDDPAVLAEGSAEPQLWASAFVPTISRVNVARAPIGAAWRSSSPKGIVFEGGAWRALRTRADRKD